MKFQFKRFVSAIGLTLLTYGLVIHQAQATLSHQINDKLSKTAVPFISNGGQTDPRVAFYASTFGGTVFITQNSDLVYDLPSINSNGKDLSWVFREVFVNKNQAVPTKYLPKGVDSSHVVVSQYKGQDTAKWKSNLKSFNSVSLGEMFPGVTVELKATGNNVEKLFYVASGANPENIHLGFEGINDVSINAEQQLVLATDLGDVTFTAPVAYQVINGKQHPVQVAYSITNKSAKQYGFKVGQYDPQYELVIDPLLASTYVGGVNANPPLYSNYDHDIAYSVISVGDSIYIGGVTQSTDFPIVLGFDDTANASGRPDGFIARFSGDLTTLYSSTFFGTENFDRVSAIALDSDGTIVAVGQAGYGFPVTPGAFNYAGTTPVGGGFVAKFSADLSTLIASAVVNPSHYATEIAIGNGGIYFAGRTNNPNFPITPGVVGTTCCRIISSFGGREFDNFAGKISSDLSTLQIMTYLSGDGVTGMAIAPDSSIYITDGFGSSITGAISHYDADFTTQLARVTLYPGTTSGSSRHYFRDVAVGSDYVVTVGTTYLNDMPVTSGAFDTQCGTDGNCNNSSPTLYIPVPDAFITKYSLDLQTILASTYFGGSGVDAIDSVGLDSAGNIVVAGSTTSSDLPTTPNAFDRSLDNGSSDIFVAKLNNDLSQLSYSSFFGGSQGDQVYDLFVKPDDSVVIAGSTSSADFPTTSGAFDRTYAGGASGASSSSSVSFTDAFISVFDTSGSGSGSGGTDPGPDPDPTPEPNVAPIADAGNDQVVGSRARVTLDGRGSSDSDGTIVSYQWRQVSGKSRTLRNADSAVANFRAPRLRNGRTYTLVFELEVTDNQGAVNTDQVTINVR